MFTLQAKPTFRAQVSVHRPGEGDVKPFTVEFRHMTQSRLQAFLDETKTYAGGTGPVVLNAAGDRASGAFDFWSLRVVDGQGVWRRSAAYQPGAGGTGTIVRFP